MKSKKPDCPNCKTNINVVEFVTKFRCAYCGEEIIGKAGQLPLINFMK